MVGGSAEEVTRPWALRDGRSWRGRALRPQCTTHMVFRAWQEAEASWAGRTGQSEAPGLRPRALFHVWAQKGLLRAAAT